MKMTEAKLSSDSMLVSDCRLLSLEESDPDSRECLLALSPWPPSAQAGHSCWYWLQWHRLPMVHSTLLQYVTGPEVVDDEGSIKWER